MFTNSKSVCILLIYSFAFHALAFAGGDWQGRSPDRDTVLIGNAVPSGSSSAAGTVTQQRAVRPAKKVNKKLIIGIIAGTAAGVGLAVAFSGRGSSPTAQAQRRNCITFVGGTGNQALIDKLLSNYC